ncbi:hypothetical protein ACIBJF_13180 [Streptomyces sp. NPDC050743]|uniref:hypothetical protein n=1 Tax=Streptomyces sp. NPDC050743 TaxID=3365634 RepID=UPI00378E52F7
MTMSLSPVTTLTVTPLSDKAVIADAVVDLGGSRKATNPIRERSDSVVTVYPACSRVAGLVATVRPPRTFRVLLLGHAADVLAPPVGQDEVAAAPADVGGQAGDLVGLGKGSSGQQRL